MSQDRNKGRAIGEQSFVGLSARDRSYRGRTPCGRIRSQRGPSERLVWACRSYHLGLEGLKEKREQTWRDPLATIKDSFKIWIAAVRQDKYRDDRK